MSLPVFVAALVRSIRARNAGDEEAEDDALADCDYLWRRLAPAERIESDELCRAIGQNEITLEEVEAKYPAPATDSQGREAPCTDARGADA